MNDGSSGHRQEAFVPEPHASAVPSIIYVGSGAVTATMTRPTLTEYDGLDRVTRTTLSDGSVQSVLYDVTDGGEPVHEGYRPAGQHERPEDRPRREHHI